MESEQCGTASNADEPTTSVHHNNSLAHDDSAMNGYVCEPNVNSKNNEVNKLSEVVRNLHTVPYIYRQDVVRSKKSGVIGIVSEVAGDSDSDSSISDEEDDEEDDDDDDDDDEEDGEEDGEEDEDNDEGNNNAVENGDGNSGADNYKCGSLQADQVRVLWMDDTEPVQNNSDVTVVDRGFLHGDYVAAASDPTGQVGVVVDANISVDLLAPDGSIVKGVSSKQLQRVREFTVGDYVVLGPWLGRINDVFDNVTVLFDDGSVCKVVRAEPMRLKPTPKTTLEDDGHFPYYPGQRVRATSSSVFKNSRWLSGLWKANRLEGTVTKVTAGSVFIYWIASAGYGPDSSTPPAEEQSPKNLKLLSCFAHANWQVGDWCLFPFLAKSSSIPIDKGLSKLQLHDSSKSELDNDQLGSGCDSEEVAVEDLNENSESMDLDSVTSSDGNNGTILNKASFESSSRNRSSSVSKEPGHEPWPVHRKKIRKVVIKRDKKSRKKEENFEKALLIVNTRTRVNVAWQDGTIEHGLNATTLIPIDSPGDHEFVPEQYVVEKLADGDDDTCEDRRAGVVKTVNAKERTACVRWLKPVARAEDPREFDKKEIVSVYELEGHSDYDYCYGDVVVRLSPVSVPAQKAGLIEESKQKIGSNEVKQDAKKRLGCKKAEDVSGDEASMDFTDLSWVGNITGLKNGDIEVTWADGVVSTVGPQAIYVVGRDDDDESVAAGSDVSDDAASWETVNDDEMDALENAQEETGSQNATGMNSEVQESVENNSGRNAALSLPLAALGFVTRLASGIFSRGRKNVDPGCLDSKIDNELPSQGMITGRTDSGIESSSQRSDVIDNCGVESSHGKEENVNDEAAEFSDAAQPSFNLRKEESEKPACHRDDSLGFKRFDIVKDPLDHHFLGTSEQTNTGRKWLKKVQQDWNILQNNLPDGIYVRVYEDRMDLLRAVIVGAYGTPYQDGLFFFDFHLPPGYPDVPPSAYYHSGGWRINPNLYEEGNVCLSLLNTWTGRGNEVWDPTSSSILQVLVSLQGLVLNSKPYFNEAGYDKQVGTAEGEKNSLAYNENTFLLNCKTMMYLMRRPPKDFDELVKDHFRRRGYYILKACDAYMKGCLIGSLTKDASASDKDNTNSTSVGFKLMLAKIVPKLLSALNEVGADCDEFKHLQQS
ncbi:Ubiquitin-conjugating enzyme like [Melia azedarach]|uniref:Ubiquitin-conjugating enzyme like n=1 Tax=Melia azedarach TaxID=155640 RepID=A0ACC1XXT2_MELAZ|nr:Ubiquitin-conjugating enzyme like [Melia azedarach]